MPDIAPMEPTTGRVLGHVLLVDCSQHHPALPAGISCRVQLQGSASEPAAGPSERSQQTPAALMGLEREQGLELAGGFYQ